LFLELFRLKYWLLLECKKGLMGDGLKMRRLAGFQYNPVRLILIWYSSVQLRVMMQIYSIKYMKRIEIAK